MDIFKDTNPNSMSDSPKPVGVGGVRLSRDASRSSVKDLDTTNNNKNFTNDTNSNINTVKNSRELTKEQILENNRRIAEDYTDSLNKNVSKQLIPTMNVFGMDLKEHYDKKLQDRDYLKESIEKTEDKKEKAKLQKRLRNIDKFADTHRKFLESYLDSIEEALGMNTLNVGSTELLKTLSIQDFKKDFYNYSVGLTKDDRQERRGRMAIYSKDLSYIKDMCGYKSAKLVDFSDNPFIPDLVNVSSFCIHEMVHKEDRDGLAAQLDYVISMLDTLEHTYGVSKSVRLNSYRLIRLIYSLFVFNAKPDLAILCGFILVQLQFL